MQNSQTSKLPQPEYGSRGSSLCLKPGDSTARRPIELCRMIDLPKISDPRGNLTFIESHRHISFEIKRVYYLYDVPGGAERGGHGHKEMQQFLIAISGSFDVLLDDGYSTKRYHMNRSYYGLYIPPMLWREMDNFSSGSVCMALASTFYDESDYYRDYETFLKAVKERG